MNDTLSTLNWLVEAGADEAVAEQPINRLTAKATVAPLQVPTTPRPAPARAPAPVRTGTETDGDAIATAQAASDRAIKDTPGMLASPFWPPVTTTSMPQASMGRAIVDRVQTASTIIKAP